MKNYFASPLLFGGLVLVLASCAKDETKATLNPNAAPQLTASATTAAITPTTGSNGAVTYNWSAADFNFPAAVTYTLQFAKAGTNFASTVDYNVGNALTKSFTVKQLNQIYNDIDCNRSGPATAPEPLDVRVRATVGDAAAPSMSNVGTIAAAPYPDVVVPTDTWGLVGPAADGWPGPPGPITDRMMTYDCRVRAYTIRTRLKADKFKFRRNRDWGINLGGMTGDYTKGLPLTLNGGDLVIAAGDTGLYTIKLAVETNAAGAATGGKVTLVR